jgi:hypothetical protein
VECAHWLDWHSGLIQTDHEVEKEQDAEMESAASYAQVTESAALGVLALDSQLKSVDYELADY